MYNLHNLLQGCNITSTIEALYSGESPNSTIKGTKTIDHIIIAKGSEDTITRSSQLPFNVGFHSDH